MRTIFEPCCEYGNQRGVYPHNTSEECDLEMQAALGPNGKCQTPSDHHPVHRVVDLQRGQWSYIVLATESTVLAGTPYTSEFFIEGTTDVIAAFRAACKHVGYRPALKQIRKGLAYGFVVTGPENEATIIPTPKHGPWWDRGR